VTGRDVTRTGCPDCPRAIALIRLPIHYGPGYRVYFQRKGNALIILLCGGDKSTQAEDIKLAKRLMKEQSK
jgi:putative addiction module killer protein